MAGGVEFHEEPEYVSPHAKLEEPKLGFAAQLVKMKVAKDEEFANKAMVGLAVLCFAVAIGIIVFVQVHNTNALRERQEPQGVQVRPI